MLLLVTQNYLALWKHPAFPWLCDFLSQGNNVVNVPEPFARWGPVSCRLWNFVANVRLASKQFKGCYYGIRLGRRPRESTAIQISPLLLVLTEKLLSLSDFRSSCDSAASPSVFCWEVGRQMHSILKTRKVIGELWWYMSLIIPNLGDGVDRSLG